MPNMCLLQASFSSSSQTKRFYCTILLLMTPFDYMMMSVFQNHCMSCCYDLHPGRIVHRKKTLDYLFQTENQKIANRQVCHHARILAHKGMVENVSSYVC